MKIPSTEPMKMDGQWLKGQGGQGIDYTTLGSRDQQYAPGTSMGLAGQQLSPQFLKQIGYTGNPNVTGYQTPNSDGTQVDPAFTKYLQDNGISLKYDTTGEKGVPNGGKTLLNAYDRNNNQIGQSVGSADDGGDGFALGGLLLAGGFGAATLAGAGAASTSLGTGAGSGTTAQQMAAYQALENGAAYGGGAGDSLVASSAGGIPGGALGSQTGGLSGMDLAADGGVNAVGGASGYAPATNAALAESAAGTPGYGASSAGAGGGAGDLTGIAGPAAGSSINPITGQASNINPITGQPFTPAMNSTLADSAAGTAGYGASSAGSGGGAGDTSGITGPTAGGATDWGSQLRQLMGGGSGSGSGGGLGAFLPGLLGLGGALATKGDTSLLNKVDYNAAAQAQGQSQRTNQTNGQGSLTYNQNGKDALGNPTYSQDVKLGAPYQANLDSAMGNQGTALGNLGRYNQGLPDAYKGVPGVYGDAGSQSALAHQQQDAMYDQQKRYLDPQYSLQSKQLDAQLANQGVTYGSDAYNSAHTQFGSQQNQAYGAARDSAINSGNAYANTLFNQNLTAHQQGMNDINNQGANYSGQASGALNGVVQNPTFAQTPGASPYLLGANLQGGANLDQYNAQVGNSSRVTGGLTGIGQSFASNPGVWNQIGNGLGGLFDWNKP